MDNKWNLSNPWHTIARMVTDTGLSERHILPLGYVLSAQRQRPALDPDATNWIACRAMDAERSDALVRATSRVPSFRTVRTELGRLGLSCRRTVHGEYRVAYLDRDERAEASAYYATELDDALNTGRAMAAWKARNPA